MGVAISDEPSLENVPPLEDGREETSSLIFGTLEAGEIHRWKVSPHTTRDGCPVGLFQVGVLGPQPQG